MLARFDRYVVLFGLSFIAQATRDKRKLEKPEAAPLPTDTEAHAKKQAQLAKRRTREQVPTHLLYYRRFLS
jgi:hypothetical protein